MRLAYCPVHQMCRRLWSGSRDRCPSVGTIHSLKLTEPVRGRASDAGLVFSGKCAERYCVAAAISAAGAPSIDSMTYFPACLVISAGPDDLFEAVARDAACLDYPLPAPIGQLFFLTAALSFGCIGRDHQNRCDRQRNAESFEHDLPSRVSRNSADGPFEGNRLVNLQAIPNPRQYAASGVSVSSW